MTEPRWNLEDDGSRQYQGEFDLTLAGDPDWNCPNCKWVNFAIRARCRNCGKHTDDLFHGEGSLIGCFEIGDDGMARAHRGTK